jgi:hypothetical protein
MELLAQRGHRKFPHESGREFARRVVGSEGVTLQELNHVMDIYYGARFGGVEMTSEDKAAIHAFVAALRALSGPTSSSGSAT